MRIELSMMHSRGLAGMDENDGLAMLPAGSCSGGGLFSESDDVV